MPAAGDDAQASRSVKHTDRQAREAAALRANLLKRKEQMRQRQVPPQDRAPQAKPDEAEDAAANEGKKTGA